jgi:hypothetical protein
MRIRTPWIEGAILMVFGCASVIEATYLMAQREPGAVPESVGPGTYVMGLGVALIITSVVYVGTHWWERADGKDGWWYPAGINSNVIGFFGITAAYVVLIGLVGYLISSLIFFACAFRMAGVLRWRTIGIVTCGMSLAYYVLFVKYCGLIFPKPWLF